MSPRTTPITDPLQAYLVAETLREPELLRRLRQETAGLGEAADMQIAPEQGQFMAFLARLIGARRVVEIGTFTGYSALVVALALPPDGRVIACDISEDWTAIARRYWAEAGVADRIDLRLGPGLETLAALRAAGADGTIDMVFVDADKESSLAYYAEALALVRPGGLILFDNALWDGQVADPDPADPETRAIRALNRRLRDDPRIDFSLVPIGDGVALARRRPA